MERNKLVSIIVPVYGVEAYLEECLDSLLNQTYENIEIILIDDQSPDRCPEICDTYSERDNRIVVIHQKNGGAANAKNTGLKQATGDYITFCDSDDLLPEDSIESRVGILEHENVDIVQGELAYLYTTGIEKNTDTLKCSVYERKEFLYDYLSKWENAIFCNKMFRKSVLENVFFLEGRCIDDEFFTYRTILNSARIAKIDKSIYIYRMRKSSVMHNKDNNQRIIKDQIDFMNFRYRDLKKLRDKELSKKYLSNLVDNYIQILRKTGIDFTMIKQIKSIFKRELFNIIKIEKHLLFWAVYYILLPKKIIMYRTMNISCDANKNVNKYFD